MGKFNLSSVYTSDNIYSVLKLLKALIDTLDTYSFEEPILDKDGNPIPMDWFKNLYNSIHGDSSGNVEIGKDAHVDGNINVDGQATIGNNINIGTWFVALVTTQNTYRGLSLVCKSNTIKELPYSVITFDATNAFIDFYPTAALTYMGGWYEMGEFGDTAFDIPAQISERVDRLSETITSDYQRKLFIHTIHIQGALSDGGLPFNVCFTALLNNNTPIDSVQDLTTQLNGTRYACTGYATSHPVYIDIGATAAATVICVTDDTGARDIALSAVSNISIQDNVFTTA